MRKFKTIAKRVAGVFRARDNDNDDERQAAQQLPLDTTEYEVKEERNGTQYHGWRSIEEEKKPELLYYI